MNRVRWIRYGVLLLMLLLALPGQAQEATQTFINYPELSESGDGLMLDLYFSVLDASGQVVPSARIQSARIVLDDGSSYDAEVSQPNTPFYIAIVLDVSGSMGGALQDMQRAAISVVQSAPAEARFAVIQFNEEVTTLQEFTTDRNRVINAIGTTRTRNLSGTCLYNAAYSALEQVGSQTAGRRAIILFTDGRDEKADGSVCSTRTYDEVVELANRPALRVPVHTIGLRGGQNPINEAELRNMAASTGGFSAFGLQADLTTLFGRIMEGLKAQWLARALVYPEQGTRIATLIATGTGGRLLQPSVATFTAPRNYARTPTPTPTENLTATPVPVAINIESIELDLPGQMVLLRLTVQSEMLVREYRFNLRNANTNLLVGEFPIEPPLPNPVLLPIGNLSDGQYAVRISALAADGSILARSNEERFTVALPTATPERATNTPVPVGVTLNNIQFDEASAEFRMGLTVLSPDRIASVRVEFVSADTNALEKTYAPPVSSITSGDLILPAEVRAGRYVIRIVSLAADGQELSRTEITYLHAPSTPTPTASPSATATPSATPTPIEASARIGRIEQPDSGEEVMVISLETENEELIQRYVIEFVDRSTNLVRKSFTFEAPPHDVLRVPLEELPGGEYVVVLKALDVRNTQVAQHSMQIGYNPPTPTPSPAPTNTPEPTAEPTAIPLFSAEGLRQNQSIILPAIVVLITTLILVLVILVRRSGRVETSTEFLAELTRAQEAVSIEPSYTPSDTPFDPDATNPEANFDPDATNPVAQLMLPPATITITRSRANSVSDQSIVVNHVPFVLGRRGRDAKGCDINFDGDDNVSRRHAEITFREGMFFITDLGSTHRTHVDGQIVPPHTPVPLNSGSTIVLGTTTVLVFEVKSPNINHSTNLS